MKKFLATLFAATLLISGCGDKAEDVKSDATKVEDAATKIEQKAAQIAQTPTVDEKFSLGGISPGMTFDEAKKILGEPTAQHDGDEFTFANGLMIDVEMNSVEEIKIRQAGVKTGAGVEVGMTEQNLIDAYGRANATEDDDGLVEHKYFSGDKLTKLEFDVSNGSIVEIKCSLND